MNKKDIFIGIIIGLIANAIGLFLAIQFFGSGQGTVNTLNRSFAQGFFTKLVSLGALLNLIAFFVFLKKKQDFKAAGVLIATVLVAIFTFIVKLI